MSKMDEFADLNFGEVLGFYLYEHGVIGSPLDVGQADLDRVTGVISYIRRSSAGEMEHYSPKESQAELLFQAMKGFLRFEG